MDYSEDKREERRQQRFSSKMMAVSAKYIRRIRELSHMPKALQPFLDTIERIYFNMLPAEVPEGMTAVGTYCVMVPQEILYAVNAFPIKLCSGSYTAFSIGDDIAPRDACPLVKAVIGYSDIRNMPLYSQCEMMIVPITCDCKKKLAYALSSSWQVSALYVPSERGRDEEIQEFRQELYKMAGQLSRITGQELTYEKLREAFQMVAEAQFELSRFMELRRKSPRIIRGTHAMTVMNAYGYMHVSRWAEAMRVLNDELVERAKRNEMAVKENRPRILVTGSPIVFPNVKIPLLIEEAGGIVAADETCMGERGLSDPPVIADDTLNGMMRALANRSVQPCSCPTFCDNKRRIYRIRQMVEDYQIQGIIYHVLRGCLVYDFEYKSIEEEFGKLGIPIIRIETDYNEEDIEQLRIRIEAFLELIKYGG